MKADKHVSKASLRLEIFITLPKIRSIAYA